MKYIVNSIFVLVLTACIFVTGCNLADLKTDPVTQEEITVMEDITTKAQGYLTPVAPVANTFVPGAGIIISGVVLLLGLIGSTTTAVIKAKKNGNTLSAVIKGVELAGDPKTKEQIKDIAGALGVEPYLNKIVKKLYPIKRG